MNEPTVNPTDALGDALARLSDLTIFALRSEWRRRYRMTPQKHLSRDLLTRGIAYRLQERAYGGLSKATVRKIEKVRHLAAGDGTPSSTSPISLKTGTRLIREWHGDTHTVLVLEDGVEWRGKQYRSLSEVAREITGARWSGPRFFGLRRSTRKQDTAAGTDHVEV
jgi:hypothetical protein